MKQVSAGLIEPMVADVVINGATLNVFVEMG